jgi:hypothetical protein
VAAVTTDDRAGSSGLILHHLGSWSPAAITTRWVPSTQHHTPAQTAAIDAAWATVCARPGVHLFDGHMARCEAIACDADRFTVDLSITSYRIFMGTNAAHPEWGDGHDAPTGFRARPALADPLGTSIALVSHDGWAVFGVRAPHLALYPGCAHPLGGTLEIGDGVTPVDITAELLREVREEADLSPDDLTDLLLIALMEDRYLRQPEAIFTARTRCDRAELETRLAQDEHTATWAVRHDPAAIDAALAADQAMTHVLRGTLMALRRSHR